MCPKANPQQRPPGLYSGGILFASAIGLAAVTVWAFLDDFPLRRVESRNDPALSPSVAKPPPAGLPVLTHQPLLSGSPLLGSAAQVRGELPPLGAPATSQAAASVPWMPPKRPMMTDLLDRPLATSSGSDSNASAASEGAATAPPAATVPASDAKGTDAAAASSTGGGTLTLQRKREVPEKPAFGDAQNPGPQVASMVYDPPKRAAPPGPPSRSAPIAKPPGQASEAAAPWLPPAQEVITIETMRARPETSGAGDALNPGGQVADMVLEKPSKPFIPPPAGPVPEPIRPD